MMMITRELICINLLFATPRKCSQELTSDGSSPGAPGSPRYRLSYSGTALPVVKHLTRERHRGEPRGYAAASG